MENPDKSVGYKKLFHFGPFCLDAAERSLSKNGESVPLLGKAFDLLLLLVDSGGHLKTHDQLFEAMWPHTIVVENSLSWYVGALRKALKDKEDGQRYIETVHGHGYRFVAPVSIERVATEPPEEDAANAGATSATIPSSADPIAATAAPAWRRAGLLALAGAAIVIIAAALVWYFALPGQTAAKGATPTIAVLPFENLSNDQANAYFAAGIQDTILSKLAGIGKLRVISRTSTRQYPSHPVNLRHVAAQLGATAVLEGSVQKKHDQVLINVQLIDPRNNDHIWGQDYTRSLADIFAVENDVATQVAAALQAKLLPEESARLANVPTGDPQAYLLFLKANYYANRVTGRNNIENLANVSTRAIALYHQAIARDPHFALAWAQLSYLESYLYWRGFSPTRQTMNEAEHAARQALVLAPTLPQAQLAMGYVDYYGHRDYAAALTQFDRVRESLPSNADVIGAIAYIDRREGKWQKALSGLQRAMLLDPRNPVRPYEIGFTLMALRQYDEAVHKFDLALALAPHDYEAASFKIMAAFLTGEPPTRVQVALAQISYGDKGRGLLMALQFRAAFLARRPDEALTAIADAPDWLSAANSIGREPVGLLRARAWALEKDKLRAQQASVKAQKQIREALQDRPEGARLWTVLGLVEACLGHKQEAIQAGRKATSLVPVSKDAIDGASFLVNLAEIYAQVGEPEQAIELLRRLLAMPAGLFISTPLLKLDPVWDPIRHLPAFQTLLNKTATKAGVAEPLATPVTSPAGEDPMPGGVQPRRLRA